MEKRRFSQINLFALLLAFILSVLLWVSLSPSLYYSKLVKGVKIIPKSRAGFVAKTCPSKIDLKIEGEKRNIVDIEKEEFCVFLDLSSYKRPTSLIYELKEEEIIKPPGIKIREIRPKNIIILLRRDERRGEVR